MADNPERSAPPAESGTFQLNHIDLSKFDNLVPGNSTDRSNDRKAGENPPSTISFPPIGGGEKKPPEQAKPSGPMPPNIYFPSLDAKPKPSEPAPRPAEQQKPFAPVAPITFPPIDATPPRQVEQPRPIAPPREQVKPADQQLAVGPGGRIEITEKDFDKIGPKAAEVLKSAGVEKLTITPGQGFDTYEATLKKPLDIKQDPNVDGCRKLTIGSTFKADVVKNPDGSYSLDNIEGLTAESKILFKWQEAQVNRIQLAKTADGQSQITSTGSWNGFSRDNTRVKPAEIFDKASFLFDRMDTLKNQARGGGAATPRPALEIPPVPRR